MKRLNNRRNHGAGPKADNAAVLKRLILIGVVSLLCAATCGCIGTIVSIFGAALFFVPALGALILGGMAYDAKSNNQRLGYGVASGVSGMLAVVGLCCLGSARLIPTFENIAAEESPNSQVTTTIVYLEQVDRSVNPRGEQIQSRADLARLFREGAARIERLQTQNVDPIAVEWAFDAAGSLREVAALAEALDAQEVQLFARSFINGTQRNFVGVLQDVAETQSNSYNAGANAMQRLDYVWEHQRAEVRARLTAKYGVQFP